LPSGAPIGPALMDDARGTEKNVKNLTVSFFTLQIQNTLPINAGCIVAPIYWRRYTYLSFFCTFFLYSLGYLRITLSQSPSLHLSSSPSLSPSVSQQAKKNSERRSAANNSMHFAYR
jgi:hypothetical protein